MAKLSARGRTEVARWTREDDSPKSDLVSWRRSTLALMSDGVLLEKDDVVFKPEGRRHSYGWKVARGAFHGPRDSKLTADLVEAWAEKRGYQRVSWAGTAYNARGERMTVTVPESES